MSNSKDEVRSCNLRAVAIGKGLRTHPGLVAWPNLAKTDSYLRSSRSRKLSMAKQQASSKHDCINPYDNVRNASYYITPVPKSQCHRPPESNLNSLTQSSLSPWRWRSPGQPPQWPMPPRWPPRTSASESTIASTLLRPSWPPRILLSGEDGAARQSGDIPRTQGRCS